MKSRKNQMRNVLTCLLLLISIAISAQEKQKPNVVILATGGTIAGCSCKRSPGRIHFRTGNHRCNGQCSSGSQKSGKYQG